MGSYLQHEVMLWGRSRRHLSQHSLTLQGNGIYGSQEGGHDLWELEGKEAGNVRPRDRQTLDSCPGNGRCLPRGNLFSVQPGLCLAQLP